MGLQAELDKNLLPDETVLISIPGSFGEAFAFTDRRALVIRERDSGLNAGCDVFGYALDRLTGAEAISSTTGGYIELKLTQASAQPDMARVYFPSYDLPRYKRAAEYISAVVSAKPEPSPIGEVALATAAGGTACPECGATMDNRTTFCSQCGTQVARVCSECGNGSPMDARYCKHCGRQFAEFVPSCPKCAARILQHMTFCPECGSILRRSCLACGLPVVENWKHCAHCGRELGSDRLDPRSAAAAQRRLRQMRDREEANARQAEPEPAPPAQTVSPAPVAEAGSVAESHNQRGQDLFENDRTEEAIREFEEAVRLEPGNPTYHCNLAVALDECGRDDEALVGYRKTLELDPNDITALLSLGYMYAENEDPENARNFWNRLIEISPDSAEGQEAIANIRHLGQL